jgi:hypothetical protein
MPKLDQQTPRGATIGVWPEAKSHFYAPMLLLQLA